ncbi:ATP-dependent helicase [Candidatus Synechococcus calcipolaris G9]|uniref:DNA 3'-5' helicase n=1 Tax=Candidatus Synechococcus calcipolaris G9 TaxID=1497997 RepID=A0ABT6F1X1_9SYNE|nr:ATP-dependent helicase [Candidatus Synechococcus calcipolaris]MDG2991822.1 ATP-dependent helicase [Candidatus Synechococcus calcipolaris G9]
METIAQDRALMQLRATLRPGQRELADWLGGPLAVSAVPGAGKSHGMAVAAAISVAREQLNHHRQLVVVTFTRSAAANIKARIRQYLNDLGLPRTGFTVQTLHGLALNIATSHPRLGLDLTVVSLISDYDKKRLYRSCVEQWARQNPHILEDLIRGQQDDSEETEVLRRRTALLTDILPKLANIAVGTAKSSYLTPADLYALADQVEDPYPILAIAADLYHRYQKGLGERQWIDYDEMILSALKLLEQDDKLRKDWQERVYAVFEDEAQDSSPLQTRLLELIAAQGDRPVNFVRVGDPNQAINSTFTSADPLFFREFCQDCQAQGRFYEMAQAGRCSPIIIEAANFLVHWANGAQVAGGELPFRSQDIQPVAANDPQPGANPPPWGQGLELHFPPDIFASVHLVQQRLAELFQANPQANAAILVRENKQGRFIADVLRNPQEYGWDNSLATQGITIFDVGGNERRSHVPEELLTLVQFLHRPHSPDYLKAALKVLTERQKIQPQDLNRLASQPEVFLYPTALDDPGSDREQEARQVCQELLQARLALPLYPLIAYCANYVGYSPTELATADSLIHQLAMMAQTRQTWAVVFPLWQDIVKSNQFENVELEETDSRYTRSGQVTIITMHKAKGLDWDAVFLPFLHAQTIPGSLWVPATAQFLGEVNLADVARAQIRARASHHPIPDLNTAWQQAKELKIAEDYRLLYVAMTRAKRLLWLSAAHKAPFSWAGFDWHRHYDLSDRPPCPFLLSLGDRFFAATP